MKENNDQKIPLLPLRGIIVYPSMVMHLDVGRDKSVAALENAMVEDSQFLLATQKNTMQMIRHLKIFIRQGRLQRLNRWSSYQMVLDEF